MGNRETLRRTLSLMQLLVTSCAGARLRKEAIISEGCRLLDEKGRGQKLLYGRIREAHSVGSNWFVCGRCRTCKHFPKQNALVGLWLFCVHSVAVLYPQFTGLKAAFRFHFQPLAHRLPCKNSTAPIQAGLCLRLRHPISPSLGNDYAQIIFDRDLLV